MMAIKRRGTRIQQAIALRNTEENLAATGSATNQSGSERARSRISFPTWVEYFIRRVPRLEARPGEGRAQGCAPHLGTFITVPPMPFVQ
jgi:hypothetical protein